MNKKIKCLSFFLLVLFSISFVNAQTDATVCCEKTVNNLYCQSVPSSQCAAGSQKAPTSCESTSFCKPGVCYETKEGICLDNTPQVVCNLNNSKWSAEAPAQCDLGCCLLGDQAAFVSLVRCKRLAGDLGLPVNYNKNLQNEAQCILSLQNQDKGACVYESEFEKTCKFVTRAECSAGIDGVGKGDFFKDRLCTDPELETNCAITTKTTCVAGKEEVYFVDSCGNAGNVYDASKIKGAGQFDLEYWKNLKKPEESCNPNSPNINSKTCGNCNYLLGSICRKAEGGNSANYGDNICANLNCVDAKGNARKHGESWCVYDDSGKTGDSKNSVGSRFYKHICQNGQEILEQCADFRQEECIEDSIVTDTGIKFSQAACRVNRWQDCLEQKDKDDCENRDRRDCSWMAGKSVCVPLNVPGLKFWEGEEAKNVCAKANTECKVLFEKTLIGGGEKCVENCQCLGAGWIKEQTDFCSALGDCGPNVNWIGQAGYKEGYTLIKT